VRRNTVQRFHDIGGADRCAVGQCLPFDQLGERGTDSDRYTATVTLELGGLDPTVGRPQVEEYEPPLARCAGATNGVRGLHPSLVMRRLKMIHQDFREMRHVNLLQINDKDG
jgi:hypothetical protein